MFNNIYNNSSDRNINTKIRTFFSDISSLTMQYWNSNISLRIYPCTGVNEEGIRQYDKNKKVNTALTADKSIAVSKKIEERIIPAIEKVKEKKTLDSNINVGVQVGGNGAVFIEYKNDEKGVPYLYLTIYTNITQEKKVSKEDIYSYKFSKIEIIEDYDPEQGTGRDSVVESEFLFFYHKLKTVGDAIGTAAHSVNSENSSKNGSRNYQNNYSGSTPSSNSSSGYQAPMSSFNEDDIPF